MSGAAALPRSAAAVAAASLPASLASQAAKARVAALGELWPEGASCHHLELRLDGRGIEVDASAAYLPDALPALARVARTVPCLAGILPFLDWAAVARPRSLWLEWDLIDGVTVGDAGPGVFFAPPDPDAPGTDDFIEAGLVSLGIRTSGREAVRTACARPGARQPRQVGVMVSRRDPGIRLVFDTGSPAKSGALLRSLGGGGAAVETLAALPGFDAARRLDIDIAPDGIGPRVAIEVPGAFLEPADIALSTAGMARLGLADPEAARAVCAAALWRSLTPGVSVGLSHLKAAMEPGQAPVVKAYLGLVPNLIISPDDAGMEVLSSDSR